MRQGTVAAASVVVMLALMPGCGGPVSDSRPSSEPPPGSTVTSPGTRQPSPAATATPSRTSAPTTATASPDRRRDQAAARRALIRAADLGSPWVAGDHAGSAAEACPGQRSALEELSFLGSVRRDLTEGRDELVNGASFGLDTLPGPDASAVREAWVADTEACREHADAYDFYVVVKEAGPRAVKDADEIVFSRVERVYFDESQDQLAYARQVVVARTGRVITTVRYTFLTTDDDPQADDFTRTQRLLAVQLAKVAKGFAE
jgi:hypothetical protein